MDVINQIANFGDEIVKWIQILGVPSAAIAFGIGGFNHVFGGPEGTRKAKPWYVGATIGLLIILGASAIATFLKGKIHF